LRAGVRWAGVDEVVGASRVLACEACALLDQQLESSRLPVPDAGAGSGPSSRGSDPAACG
jgi:hypothetical protein